MGFLPGQVVFVDPKRVAARHPTPFQWDRLVRRPDHFERTRDKINVRVEPCIFIRYHGLEAIVYCASKDAFTIISKGFLVAIEDVP